MRGISEIMHKVTIQIKIPFSVSGSWNTGSQLPAILGINTTYVHKQQKYRTSHKRIHQIVIFYFRTILTNIVNYVWTTWKFSQAEHDSTFVTISSSEQRHLVNQVQSQPCNNVTNVRY